MFDIDPQYVFARGLATISVCLTLHCFVMFLSLRLHIAFRRWFPRAQGIQLVVPSILSAAALLVISTFLQIGIWATVLWGVGHFETVPDVIYFSGTTFTTLGTGKHVLVPPFCVLEPMEATHGILVAGLNTAILFAIISSVARLGADYGDFFR